MQEPHDAKEKSEQPAKTRLSCSGCGIPLQTEDEARPGYVPVSALEREDAICQRCFRIKHYGEVAPVPLDADDFLRILDAIGQTRALVVKVVDIFDFNGSWLRGLHRFVGKNPVLLAGNKVDLLPKETNHERVKHWLRHEAKELGLKPHDVVLCSASKGMNIDGLIAAIERLREGRDVYVVGATNVGKSTLINELLHRFGGQKRELTTSRFPGTTLDRIEIPLGDGTSLYDTPGIVNRDQIVHLVSPQELKMIAPDRVIRPKVYQLNARQTLFLGGLARIDFVKGERQSFVVYASNRLPIHRTKLEKADEIYRKHVGEMLVPPAAETLKTLPELTRHHFRIPPEQKMDVVISGLGWVAVKGSGALVEAWAPKGISVTLRKALL
ncbi:ribosome biogenesis GTPase YqeH [Bacillaceae bacterium]